jgi:hypothetical protein
MLQCLWRNNLCERAVMALGPTSVNARVVTALQPMV